MGRRGGRSEIGIGLATSYPAPSSPPAHAPRSQKRHDSNPPANDIPLCTALQNLGGPRVPLPWPRHMSPGCRRDRIRSFTFSLRRVLLYSLNLRARRSARARRARDLCGRLRAAERNGGRRRGAGLNPAPKGINEHGAATPGAIFYPSSRGPVSHNERSSAVRSEHHQRVHFRDPRERPISSPGLQPRAEKIDERHVVRLCETNSYRFGAWCARRWRELERPLLCTDGTQIKWINEIFEKVIVHFQFTNHQY